MCRRVSAHKPAICATCPLHHPINVVLLLRRNLCILMLGNPAITPGQIHIRVNEANAPPRPVWVLCRCSRTRWTQACRERDSRSLTLTRLNDAELCRYFTALTGARRRDRSVHGGPRAGWRGGAQLGRIRLTAPTVSVGGLGGILKPAELLTEPPGAHSQPPAFMALFLSGDSKVFIPGDHKASKHCRVSLSPPLSAIKCNLQLFQGVRLPDLGSDTGMDLPLGHTCS